MDRTEAIEILGKACKTKKQKEAFSLLFGADQTAYKCRYYHEICSHCMNWPSPEDIVADKADDCCIELEISRFYGEQENVRKTGQCRYFMEF